MLKFILSAIFLFTLNVNASNALNINVNGDSVVHLNTGVNKPSVDLVLKRLSQLEKKKKKIFLVITSPGGSVIEGARIVSFIENSKSKIYTVCATMCASMGAIIHQYGYKRFMVDRSLLMFHPARGGLRGTLPEMTGLLTALNRYVNAFNSDIASRSDWDYNKFMKESSAELWLSSREAKLNGFTDRVIKLNVSDSSKVFDLNLEMKKHYPNFKFKNEAFREFKEIRSFR